MEEKTYQVDKMWEKYIKTKVLKWHKTKSLKSAFDICEFIYDSMTEEERRELEA